MHVSHATRRSKTGVLLVCRYRFSCCSATLSWYNLSREKKARTITVYGSVKA
jgi:hypothetical protein